MSHHVVDRTSLPCFSMFRERLKVSPTMSWKHVTASIGDEIVSVARKEVF